MGVEGDYIEIADAPEFSSLLHHLITASDIGLVHAVSDLKFYQ
jgi:hypothetical protein